MGAIRDRVTSPEFSELTALEKAKERPKLFQLYLDADSGFAASYAEADDTGKQSMARQFTDTLNKEFPEQFSTTGWVWTHPEGRPGLLDRRPTAVPVLDIESERYLQDMQKDAATRQEGFDRIQAMPEDDPNRPLLRTLVAARIGDVPGKIPEDLISSYGTRSISEIRLREASARVLGGGVRFVGTVIPALAAGTLAAETGPGAIAAAAAGGAAGSQLSERPARALEAMITGYDYVEPTLREDLANAFLGGMIGPLQGPTRGMNALRQGLFGASASLAGQQIASPETPLSDKVKNAGVAGLVSAALGGALPTSRAAAPRPSSRTETPPLAESPALDDLEASVPPWVQKRRDDAIAAFTSAEMDGVSARNPLYFEKLKQDLAAEAEAAAVRKSDFLKAHGEQLKGELAGVAPTVGEGESIVLEGSDAAKQLTVARTRRGESARETARLRGILEQEAPFVPVDEPLPPLSSQAQRMYDRYGVIDAKLMTNLAGTSLGATVGFVRGLEDGETPEDRLFNAVMNGVRGAGIGFSIAYTGGKGTEFILRRGEAAKRARTMLSHMATGREDMPDWYLRARSTPALQAVRTNFYSTLSKVKDAVAQLAGKVDIPENANPYLVGKLYPSYGRRIESTVKPMFEDAAGLIHAVSKSSGLGDKDFQVLFNNWMEAMHTPDYNAARIKAGQGLTRFTPTDIKTITDQVEALGLTDTFRQLKASTIDPMIALDRQIRLDSGLISQELLDGFKRDFPNYVPFHRELEEEGVQLSHGSGIGGGKNVLGSGIRSAKGSELPVSDILGSVTYNLTDAIKRAARNEYGKSVAQFVRLAEESGNPLPGVTVRAPKVVGSSGDRPILEAARPNHLSFFDNGKRMLVDFDDPILARDFGTYDDPKLTGLLQLWQKGMGIAASLKTRFNLNFLLANMPRDRGDAAVEALSRGDLGGAVSMMNPALALRDDFLPAVQHAMGNTTGPAEEFQKMLDAGGLPGGWASSTKMEYESYIQSLVKEGAGKKAAMFVPREVAKLYDLLGAVSEGSTRYAAWRRAKLLGATDGEAALAARDSSLDFDMKGRMTHQLALVRNFVNPALQSSVKAGKWVVRNPGVVPVLATGIASVGMLSDQINSGYDENWKQSRRMQYERRNGFPFIYGRDEKTGDFLVHTFPIPQSLRPLKAVVDFSSDYRDGSMEGEESVKRRFAEMLLLSLDAANPLGGSADWKSAITPSLIEPLMDVRANKSFTGAPIVPSSQEIDPKREEWSKFRPDLLDSWHGRMAIAASETMRSKMGVDISPQKALYLASQYGAGAYRTAEQFEGLVTKLLEGSDIHLKDVPGAAGVFRSYTPATGADADPRRVENELRIRAAVSEYGAQRNRLRYEADQSILRLQRGDDATIFAEGQKLMQPANKDLLEVVTATLKREEAEGVDAELLRRPVGVRINYVEKLFASLPNDTARAQMASTLQGRPWVTKEFRQEWRERHSAAPSPAPESRVESREQTQPPPAGLLQQLRASRSTE
jgi:hypothetical protein